MSEHKPWWPRSKNLPFFTSSAEYEAHLSADDRIDLEDIEDERKEEHADGVSPDTATRKSDEQ